MVGVAGREDQSLYSKRLCVSDGEPHHSTKKLKHRNGNDFRLFPSLIVTAFCFLFHLSTPRSFLALLSCQSGKNEQIRESFAHTCKLISTTCEEICLEKKIYILVTQHDLHKTDYFFIIAKLCFIK